MKDYQLPDKLSNFLTQDDWKNILSYTNVNFYQKNDILFNEGDEANFAGIILSGEILIKKNTDFTNKQFILSILDSGSFIGENFIVSSVKVNRNVTAVIKEPCEIAIMDKNTWNLLISENLRLANKLLVFLVYTLSSRLANMNNRIEAIF